MKSSRKSSRKYSRKSSRKSKNGGFEIDLSKYEKKIFSQNGEDGILEKIINCIPNIKKYYVEFGVEDCSECNSRYLREKYKWKGLLMDSGFSDESINLKKEFIKADNILQLFSKYNAPHRFGLLMIDVDYNDFYILNSILKDKTYSADIIVLEYNGNIPYGEDKIVIYDPEYTWHYKKNKYFGCSFMSYKKLLDKYGYKIIYCDNNGVNLFAIKKSIIKKNKLFFLNQNKPELLYKKFNPINKNLYYIFKKVDVMLRNYIPYKVASNINIKNINILKEILKKNININTIILLKKKLNITTMKLKPKHYMIIYNEYIKNNKNKIYDRLDIFDIKINNKIIETCIKNTLLEMIYHNKKQNKYNIKF